MRRTTRSKLDEDGFWRKLRAVLPPGHYTRTENLVQPGMPDVNFCVNGVEGWMELKYTEKFPLEHPVLMTQDLWIEQHRRAGGRAGICVGYKSLVFFVIDTFGVALNDWRESTFLEKRNSICVPLAEIHLIQVAFRSWIRLLQPSLRPAQKRYAWQSWLSRLERLSDDSTSEDPS